MYKKSPIKVWRKQKNKYRINGASFGNNEILYPPKKVQPGKLDESLEYSDIKGGARLITWSVVRSAPSGFTDQVPYAIGIMELTNGQRFTGQIVDIDFDKLKKNLKLLRNLKKPFDWLFSN